MFGATRPRKRRGIRAGAILVTASWVPTPALSGDAPRESPREALTRKIDSFFAEWDTPGSPGCALGVIKDGEPLYARGYGMADIEHDVPLAPVSVMSLASESKQFTAAAVLFAVEQGHLALDHDVRTYVPELPEYGRTITVRHLLHHTSGLRDYGTLWLMAGEKLEDAHTSEETLDLLTRQKELNFLPGDEYSYSNSGYFLLGVVLKRATGKSLREFANEILFEPARMRDTRYRDDHTELVANRAIGHIRRGDGKFGRYGGNAEVVGAGGLLTTVRDLALWERSLYDRKLRENALIDRMTEPGTLNDGEKLHYAGGLVPGDFDGLATLSHGGRGDGFSTFILRFPQMRFAVVCLCNLAGVDAPGLAWRTAVTYLYGAFAEEAAALQRGSAPPEFVELSEAQLGAWAGAYRNTSTRAVWKVDVGYGELFVDTGGGGFQLRPLGARSFRKPGHGQGIEATFDRDEKTGARSMRVEIEDQRPLTFAEVRLASPSPDELSEYAGEYFSEELGVPWTLAHREGKLFFVGTGAPTEPLTPTIADEFALGPELVVVFERDERDRIRALTAHTERVRSLCFGRRESPATSPSGS